MKAALLVALSVSLAGGGCTLVSGYDFDGYHLGAGGAATGAPGQGAGGGGGACADDYDSDPHNCGACGHDCLGGECKAGACQPFVIFSNGRHQAEGGIGTLGDLTLVQQPNHPSLLFWVDAGDQGAAGNTGLVWRALDDGSDAFPLAAPANTEAVAVTTGAANVYWTSREGSVKANNFGGNGFQVLFDGAPPNSMRGIATSGSDVYFAVDASIKRLNLISLDAVDSATGQSNPLELVLAETLYWTNYGSGAADGSIMRLGDPASVVLASSLVAPRGLLVEPGAAGQLYFTTGDGSVWGLPKDGSRPQPERLVTPDDEADVSPMSITADADFLYWTSWGSCVNANGCGELKLRGRVQRIRKDGTERTQLLDGFALPTGIAVDDKAVYFTTWFFTTVMKLAK